MAALAMTAHGGLAILSAADDTQTAQPLDAGGHKHGAAKPFEWPEHAAPTLVPAGDHFLAYGEQCAGYKSNCISVAWIDPDGTAGPRIELDSGERRLAPYPHAVGDHVRLLALRGKATSDLWLDIARASDARPAATRFEVDLGGDIRTQLQDEPDGPWLVSDSYAMKRGVATTTGRYANADGKAGAITGWTSGDRLLAVGPGRRLLAERGDTWLDMRLEADGKLTELAHIKRVHPLPAPFVETVRADEETGGGIELVRDGERKTQISTTLAPIVGPVAWASGRFFVVYGERTKRSTLIKVTPVSCK